MSDIYINLDPKDQLLQLKVGVNRRHREQLEAIQREWDEHPERKEEFLQEIRQRNRDGAIEGFLNGWWELDEDGNMAAPAKVFKLSDFADVKNPTLAHVIAAADIFPSVSQARKNGWDKPLVVGEWEVTKKKIRVRVVK